MAAKDYKICASLLKIYIAKPSKKSPNLMTDDRRELEEDEMLMVIDWYLNHVLGENGKALFFNSCWREGKRVQVRYIDDKKA